MKKYTNRISALLAIIIFSACVAIPENPPMTPTPRPEREASALASALAKMYRVDYAGEIHNRLNDLEECIFHAMAGETTLTPEELDAIVIYMVGSLQTTARFSRYEAFREGTLDKYYDPDTVIKEEQVIQEFNWTIDMCYGR